MHPPNHTTIQLADHDGDRDQPKGNKDHSLLQRINRLLHRILAHNQRLDPCLFELFQRANRPDMRVRRAAGPELSRTLRRPADLRVVSGTRVAPRTRGEDGRLAGAEVGRRHEEHQLEALRDSACHLRFVSFPFAPSLAQPTFYSEVLKRK